MGRSGASARRNAATATAHGSIAPEHSHPKPFSDGVKIGKNVKVMAQNVDLDNRQIDFIPAQ
jgi:triosephosphate isomerase